jgi:hypothetical protein
MDRKKKKNLNIERKIGPQWGSGAKPAEVDFCFV